MYRFMTALALGLIPAFAGSAEAHDKTHKNQNVKVLVKNEHEQIEQGMKGLAKGLGVKCTACHVKGHFEKDDVAAKIEARGFLTKVVGEPDATKKKAALDELLRSMKLGAPKNEEEIWRSVASWKKE